MENEKRLVDAILNAPGWVRLGITAPAHHLRLDAARELVRIIVEGVEGVEANADQPTLPL